MRHVVCHIYPRSHGTWRRTVAHLKARSRLFDGRRVIAIAVDDSTDTADVVRRAFDGFDAEFLVVNNCPELREAYTHWRLFDCIPRQQKNDSIFYCHGKGSTHQLDSVCQWWADLQWHICCDYPDLLAWSLNQKPIVGCFRAYQRLGVDWHFSGSFYWMRSRDVFARSWRRIDPAWFGVETWPARHFRVEESACLFLDYVRDLYSEPYWRTIVSPLFQHWRATVLSCGPPTMDFSTTDYSLLPETRFLPLIGLGGSGTTARESESSPQTDISHLPVADCLTG